MPATKDYDGECDKALAVGHLLTKCSHVPHGESSPTQTRECATGGDPPEPGASDIDTHRVGSHRVLANCSCPKAQTGAKQDEPEQWDTQEGQINGQSVFKHHRAENGDFTEERNLHNREGPGVVNPGAVFCQPLGIQEVRHANDQDVEDDTNDDLVHQIAHGKHRKDRRHQSRRNHGSYQSEIKISGQGSDHGRHEGTSKQLALDSDIHDTYALGHHASHTAENDGDGKNDGVC